MEKVIRDGRVAVLYSPGYGAGWFSWHRIEALLYDPVVVEMVEQNRREEVVAYCNEVYGTDGYYGGASDLEVKWVPVGAQFRVHEYDGYESIVFASDEVWLTA